MYINCFCGVEIQFDKINGPKLLWAEIEMGRFCYGPKWPGTDESWKFPKSLNFKKQQS